MEGSFCLPLNCFTSLLDKKYGCKGQPLSSDLFQKNARFVKESRQNSFTFNNRLKCFLIQDSFNTEFFIQVSNYLTSSLHEHQCAYHFSRKIVYHIQIHGFFSSFNSSMTNQGIDSSEASSNDALN